ncbi:hypothetical protein CEXT_284301 [Caerostris extrusa]|uniref:Uncharacterized protein n=1 Tax=Caerostris extrusa TaxID=172846 RepID=A0AAV4Q5A4_CAEEX|nr:hypothetical protein CEXT_284301 [Caerostris extrusa]
MIEMDLWDPILNPALTDVKSDPSLLNVPVARRREFSRWKKKEMESKRMIFVILLALLVTASAKSNGACGKLLKLPKCLLGVGLGIFWSNSTCLSYDPPIHLLRSPVTSWESHPAITYGIQLLFLPINKPEKATKISRKPVPVTKMAAPKSLPITVYYVALKKSVLEDGRFLIELVRRLCKK